MANRRAQKTTTATRRAAPGKRVRHEPLREQARDVFRLAILEAAERVFARKGFIDTKVNDIAREAGMAAGTLYNYFDSKDAIYQSISALRSEESLEQARAIAFGAGKPLERLERLIAWFLEYIESHSDQFQMHLAMRSIAEWEMKQVHGEAALANYLEHLAILASLCGEAQRAGDLRTDVPAADLATALAGSSNGFIHAWLLSKPRERLSARAKSIFDLFCKGAAR